jgi:hypothetical protein
VKAEQRRARRFHAGAQRRLDPCFVGEVIALEQVCEQMGAGKVHNPS